MRRRHRSFADPILDFFASLVVTAVLGSLVLALLAAYVMTLGL